MDFIGENMSTDYIVAIEEGVVVTSRYSDTAGYFVEIKHNNGYISRYLHMLRDSLLVKVGDNVVKGQRLGYMGNSGSSNGKHLHFAVVNTTNTPQDPLPYLQNTLNFNIDCLKDFVTAVQKSLGVKVDVIITKQNKTWKKITWFIIKYVKNLL